MEKSESTASNVDSLESHGAMIGELVNHIEHLRARVYALQTVLVEGAKLASHDEVQERTNEFLRQFLQGLEDQWNEWQEASEQSWSGGFARCSKATRTPSSRQVLEILAKEGATPPGDGPASPSTPPPVDKLP
jgi:hypothetical protein